MIILHPDFLVSSTVVADSFSCVRKAVFQDRVKATGDISKPMVYGNILHSLFQIALEANDFSTVFLRKSIDSLVVRYVESLYMLKEPLSVAAEYLCSKIHLIQDWASLFVSKKPKANAFVTEHRTRYNPVVAITKLLDIEEHVWSPMFGLKGMIDATVQATIIDHKSEKVLTIPLEFKTGKSTTVMMHRAQTMLYTLLMSDRYDIDVQCGLLYYLENKEMIRVPAIRDELRGMIIGRNRLASYIRNREVLPDMLRSRYTCGNCYVKETCFIYHKLLEDGTPKTSGVEDHFHDMTGHLGKSHQKFFGHWDNLLSKEEKDISRFRKELWGLLSSEREALGRCFGQLVIVPGSISVDSSASKINRYTYILTKGEGTAVPGFTFLDSMINPGEPIVISDEKGHFALALGYITEIRYNRVTVRVDRRLHNARTRKPGFNKKTNQVFAGIMEVSKDGEEQDFPQSVVPDEGIRYRLDKDEFSNGMASVRNNLIQIMSPRANEKYRKLLVDLEPPVFKISPTAYSVDSSSQTNLNGDQRKAIEKVMSAQDYALVLGMPGTGKTTTIAHIIRALVGQGKSVLLTSYTHTAVDNILLKIKNDNIDTLRLGSGTKIHPEVKSFAQLAEGQKTSFEELRETFHMPKIVATTCLGVNHPIFSERKFDYCIVDEASQITLPVCLGPIRMANTFILVGDHYQLPPLVRSPEAREGGLDISLFKLLSDAHPQSVVNLEHQYRMCEEIMTLSNDLIYKGKLKCGNEQVAKRTLQIPHIGGLVRHHSSTQYTQCGSGPCWIRDLFADGVKACFVNTDNVPAKEVRKGDRINNPIEADIAYQLVEGFLSCGVDPSSIGVISVYRSQIKILQNLLRNRPSVEMHTADKFQGRDKEIIVISLVRSNGDQNVGELLRDWRRINVAFTRARSKLLILGSRSTLQSNELLADFVRLMERNKWVYDLPPDAQSTHFMPQTQPSASTGFKKAEPTKGPENRVNGKKSLSSRHGFLGNRPVLRDIVNGAV
ncbi:unnamed protein product [Tuber melanosporum]|uniref:DNA replication ATP-dependent helicase/nuclease n=1 Tax=Tuber melanosporum (strain Mel28) TaxID=656061 RepID=D5G6Z1_TUBMM|nr:uncharacterized protein GSTUM_00002391001 [Tuber melanosporum]CAZ80284.1 unnamed protein product [Tuber melanosporum]